MSKGSAIISILLAFLAGVFLGHVANSGGGGGEEPTTAIEDDAVGGPVPEIPADGVERQRVDIPAGLPQRGPDDALVTIVMWSDYQCPFCSRVEPTLSRIMNEHPNDVRIVWRDNPLPMHPQAPMAAQAAREAHAQGGDTKFWQFHDLMFENQRALERADLDRYAQQLGLNMQRFAAALDGSTHQAAIAADMQAAQGLGAQGTPAFFINGRNLMGAQPYEAFNTIVTEELANAQRLVGTGVARGQLYAGLMASARTGAAPAPAEEQRPAQRQPNPATVYRVPVGNSPSRGPDTALVTIVQFSEFQCPFCSRVLPTMNQLHEQYGDDVRIVFRHNPLGFHDNAMPAAEASTEVFTQRGSDAFWRYHDILFQNQQALTRENLETWAQQVGGVDMTRFRAALDNHTHQAAIQADQQVAMSLGASGTPAFFINGRNLRGAQPVQAFQAVIEQELARARAALESGTPRAQLYERLTADGATAPQFIDPPGGAAPAERPADPDANRVYEIAVPRNSPSKGPANAPVTIQIFSDFQCPFCSRVLPTVRQVEETYGTRVRFVWRDYPLPMHPQAPMAAEAAREVFTQGGSTKFWQFHDLLFENQRTLAREDLERFAQQVGGINMPRFNAALDNHTHQAAVQADVEAVNTAGARIGTPSFFINGRLLQGAQPFPEFQRAIDAALAN